jgi:hypothetical protein
MNVTLGPVAIGMQQSTAVSHAMTGVENGGVQTWNSTRGVIETPELGAPGGGLFDPHPVAKKFAPFCTTVFISCGSNVTWTLYMTSGIAGGIAGQVNDPAQDVPIASGTGPSLEIVNREFLRTQLLRVVVGAAAVVPNLVIANFISTSSSGGRVIA